LAVGVHAPIGYPAAMRTPAGGIAAIPPGSRGEPDASPDAGKGSSGSTAPPGERVSTPPRAELEHELATSARASASLDALQAAIAQASAGMQSALDVNSRLATELAEVKSLLDESLRNRQALDARVDQLERQLEDALREAARSRDFLIEEQDRFLAGILDEHEHSLRELRRERDAALVERSGAPRAHTPRAPDTHRTSPGIGDSSPPPMVSPKTAETARPGQANRTNPGLAPPPAGVTAPIDASIESLDKLLAERERSRDVLKRLQEQRDEAQKSLTDTIRERDELLRELEKLAPERFKQGRRPWSPHDARRTVPAIPMVLHRSTDPSPATPTDPSLDPSEDADESIGDRVTSPPSDDAFALLSASRPSPAEGTPAQTNQEPETGADGKPLLKRKPDPTRKALGGYSLSGDDVSDEADSGQSPGSR